MVHSDKPKRPAEWVQSDSDDADKYPVTQGTFNAPDGTSLFFESRGEGKPLIFCYGLTCRRDHWRHQARHFVKHYRVITFDYRGHHASQLPKNDRHLSLEWCAKDIQALYDHLELEDAVCLGHSMGVTVLTRAALLLESRLRGMVFICGSVHNPFEQMFHTNRLKAVYEVSSFLFDTFPETSSKLWGTFTKPNGLGYLLTSQFGFNATRSKREDIQGYLEGVHKTPLPVFHYLLRDYVRYDGRPDLEKIAVPTLVVAGEDDWITPMASQEEIASLLPSGELAKIPGGSHNAHTDFPGEVNARIDEFLGKIGYR